VQRAAREERERDRRQVAVAIRDLVRSALDQAEQRREQDRVGRRRDERRGVPARAPREEPAGGEHARRRRDVAQARHVDRQRELVDRREVHGPRELRDVEAEAVRAGGEAPERAEVRERVERGDLDLREERHAPVDDREREPRPLLQDERPPAHAGRAPPQRMDVEQEQHDRQRDADLLAQEREGKEHDAREPARRRAGRLGTLDRAQPGEQREQEQQPAQDVAPLGRPRHRLDAQRMEREEERRAGGGGEERARRCFVRRARRAADQPQRDEEDGGRARAVQEEVREQEPERRLRPPDPRVDREREPRERLVVAHEERREHPAQVARTEPAIRGVLDQARLVVEHEPAVQPGQERDRRDRRDRQRDDGEKETFPVQLPTLRAGARRRSTCVHGFETIREASPGSGFIVEPGASTVTTIGSRSS
jgi:hypothetical protein